MTHRVGVIRGDGTGPEVVGEGLKVLEAVRDGFETRKVDLGLADDAAAEALGNLPRLCRAVRHLAARHGAQRPPEAG